MNPLENSGLNLRKKECVKKSYLKSSFRKLNLRNLRDLRDLREKSSVASVAYK